MLWWLGSETNTLEVKKFVKLGFTLNRANEPRNRNKFEINSKNWQKLFWGYRKLL